MIPPVMAQIVATQIFRMFERFLLNLFGLHLSLFGAFVISINCIRNCVGLVNFGLFVLPFDFRECQKMVKLLVKLGQAMHIKHIRVKVGFMLEMVFLVCCFCFLFFLCFFMSFMFWSLLNNLVRVF